MIFKAFDCDPPGDVRSVKVNVKVTMKLRFLAPNAEIAEIRQIELATPRHDAPVMGPQQVSNPIPHDGSDLRIRRSHHCITTLSVYLDVSKAFGEV